MPQADLELFTLGATTPESGVAHGSAMTQAGLHAGAEFRRGVRLGASFQLAAEAQGALGSTLAAEVTAGVSAKAAVSLDVGFPLDLFDEAGIVARFRAQAEAAAYVRVRVALSASELASLTEQLLPPAIRPMHRAFLEEVDVGAGFWARAAFAAQIQAEAILAGSLLPGAPGGPGFSLSLGYGVGLGAAAGKAFVANVGLRDPRRLLDRLATELSALVVAEAERAIEHLDADDREPARRALAVTRILVPLATRTAFSLGLDLALASTADERTKATESVVGSFVNEAQRVLLEGVTELALGALADAVGRDALVGAFLADETRRTAAAAHLRELDARLASLEHVPSGDPKAWLAAVTALAAPVDALVSLAGPAAAEADAVRHALARLWAAAVLLDRVLGWADNPARGVADLFGTTPVVTTGAESIAARIGASLGRPAGASLHLSDLVSFVTGQDLEADLRARVPAVAPALDWLATASGAAGGQIVQRLLVDLAAPDQQSLDSVLEKLGQAAAQVVNAEVVPRVLRPIKDENPGDEALHLVIDRMATPLLVALPIVVVPGLAKLDDPEGSKRLREALSAVLLQILNRFLMATTDVVFQRALDVGEDALRALGDEVEQVGEAYPAFGVVSAVASRSIIPVSIVPQDLAAMLDIAAGMTEIINRTQRQPVIALIGSALELGLGDDATRAQVAAGLLDTDDRIRPEDTDRLLVQMRSGAWELVRYAAPRILDLLLDILLREIRLIAELIEAGAKAVVAAAKAAIAAAAALLAQLEAELRRLAQEALRLLAQIASRVQDVVARVAAIQAAALARIKAAGRALLDQLLAALPGWTAWAHDEIRALYDLAFDALAWALSAPLQLVASVAGWINEAVLDGLRWASYDGPAIRRAIRDRVAASGASDLEFDLAVYAFGERIGPPKFTIQAGAILQRIADAVLDDPIVKAVIDAVAADAVSVQAVRAQEATLAEAKANQGTPPDPKTIVPGAPVAVSISGVANGGQASGPVPLRIRIAGANRSFVQTTLGVPPRVTLRVNGQRWNVDPADWVEVNGGIELAATIVPVATSEAEPPPAPTIHAGSLVRETELVAIADRVRGDIVVGKLDKATRVWDGVAVRRGVEDVVRLVEPRPVPVASVPVASVPIRPKPIRSVSDPRRPLTIDQPALVQPQVMQPQVVQPPIAIARTVPAPVARLRTPTAAIPGGEVRAIAFADVAGLTATAAATADHGAFTFTARDTVHRLPVDVIRHVQLATEATDVAPSRVEAVAMTATTFRASTAQLPTLDERTLLAIAAEPSVTGTVVAGLPGVNVVQVAVADGESRVAHGRLLFHLVERQLGIEVADVVLDRTLRVDRERVVLRSTGTVPIDLEGWTLRDAAGSVFTFPRVTLRPGARLTVYTGRGRNTRASLYWGRGKALWRREGAMAILHDASGKEMARRVVARDPGPAR